MKNPLGLHTRPATTIVQMLQSCKSDVTFTYKKETVDAKSILNILMLAIHKSARITITVSGVDAQETMALLVDGFNEGFGEVPASE